MRLSFETGSDDENVDLRVKSLHDVHKDPRFLESPLIQNIEDQILQSGTCSRDSLSDSVNDDANDSSSSANATTQDDGIAPNNNASDASDIVGTDRASNDKSSTLSPESSLDGAQSTESIVSLEIKRYISTHRATIGKRRADDISTMLALNQFCSKLSSSTPAKPIPAASSRLCKLHGLAECQSCISTFGLPVKDIDDAGWMSHRFVRGSLGN